MTLSLPWRDVDVQGHPTPTSLTGAEIAQLEQLAAGRHVLEVGSAYGYSTAKMALAAALHIVSVDPHDGYGAMPGSLARMTTLLHDVGVRDLVEIFIGTSDSALPSLVDEHREFELVFVDGDHRADAVRHDVLWATRLVADGGVIACHDYRESACPEVAPAIDALIAEGVVKKLSLVDTLMLLEPAGAARLVPWAGEIANPVRDVAANMRAMYAGRA